MKGSLKPDRKPRIYRGEDVTDFLPSFLFWKKPPARRAFAPSSPIPSGGGRGRQLHAAWRFSRGSSCRLQARARSCRKQNTTVTPERLDGNPLTSFQSSPLSRFPRFPPNTLYALLVFPNQDRMRPGQISWRRSVGLDVLAAWLS